LKRKRECRRRLGLVDRFIKRGGTRVPPEGARLRLAVTPKGALVGRYSPREKETTTSLVRVPPPVTWRIHATRGQTTCCIHLEWCRRGDSNPHGTTSHKALNLARLPNSATPTGVATVMRLRLAPRVRRDSRPMGGTSPRLRPFPASGWERDCATECTPSGGACLLCGGHRSCSCPAAP
jgi:hypothetical protein